ncbi:hypothetical protein EIN_429620 [Entamoeba invadens IP1]|uniref:TNFR-Cys domain-containing protein n=1 Tax=Entamoeba invadens IP1 TaxID=370355 RepID=A0A0A1UEZ8_ENTIV|nr:hypothetical protein EIN_429620 [Entamoeba invadens IP1]ELP95186.1 hypothetical protein EIN_429620 [Entamoeba invadens IP1]|eukprot:XP_004261957.1 hypothetical protein EIN_429620 [Entamoeba invadens IP1]
MQRLPLLVLCITLALSAVCKDGEYTDVDSTCKACPEHCSSCLDSKLCQRCAPGYEFQVKDSTFVCAKCTDDCVYCSAGVCSVCRDSYVVKDGKCNEVVDNSKLVIGILGGIVAIVVIVIGVDILVSFIMKKVKKDKDGDSK